MGRLEAERCVPWLVSSSTIACNTFIPVCDVDRLPVVADDVLEHLNSFSKSHSKQFVGLWFVFIRKQQMSGKCITFLAMDHVNSGLPP